MMANILTRWPYRRALTVNPPTLRLPGTRSLSQDLLDDVRAAAWLFVRGRTVTVCGAAPCVRAFVARTLTADGHAVRVDDRGAPTRAHACADCTLSSELCSRTPRTPPDPRRIVIQRYRRRQTDRP